MKGKKPGQNPWEGDHKEGERVSSERGEGAGSRTELEMLWFKKQRGELWAERFMLSYLLLNSNEI